MKEEKKCMRRKCVEERNLRWIWDNAKKKREKEIDRSFSLAKERKLNGNFGRSLYTRSTSVFNDLFWRKPRKKRFCSTDFRQLILANCENDHLE